MKRKRFTEEQIAFALRQAESGIRRSSSRNWREFGGTLPQLLEPFPARTAVDVGLIKKSTLRTASRDK